MKLDLKDSTWKNIFDSVRDSKINSKGNFWVGIQNLEGQYEEQKTIKNKILKINYEVKHN